MYLCCLIYFIKVKALQLFKEQFMYLPIFTERFNPTAREEISEFSSKVIVVKHK